MFESARKIEEFEKTPRPRQKKAERFAEGNLNYRGEPSALLKALDESPELEDLPF